VPQEEAEFAAWKRGELEIATPDTDSWLAHLRDTTAAGVHWWRIRILDYPLADYSAFELHAYQGLARAGEKIYVADRAWSEDLHDLHEDFWVFDNSIVIRMIYDDEGHFVRPERVAAMHRHLEIRATARRHAVPLEDYLRDNDDAPSA
jgi:hypothetical protein